MDVLRYTAFSDEPSGGNPAGVVLDATGASDGEMLAVAADVGFSETAFLLPGTGGRFGVRYFSPRAEVPFCGHATIATAVAWAERHGRGTMLLDTAAGEVRVTTEQVGGRLLATLTSVAVAAPSAPTRVVTSTGPPRVLKVSGPAPCRSA